MTGRLGKLDEIDYGGEVRVEAKLSAELTNLPPPNKDSSSP
jgi:hypothetical protein